MRKPILSAPISRLAAALVAGSLASTALVPLAHAQKAGTEAKKDAAKKPDKKTRDAARKAYGAGEKAYGAGNYTEALDNFKQANSLIPSPHAEYWIAMCLDKEGKSAEAYAAFKKFFWACLERGVYIAPSPYETGFISLAHDFSEIDKTLEVFDAALRTL